MNKNIEKTVCLQTPSGDVLTSILIQFQENEISSHVFLQLNYQEHTYISQGTDYLWMDAFAALEEQLPDNVKLKCCLTCRHGNLCPVGTPPDTIYCMEDVLISEKYDVLTYLIDREEDDTRKRSSTYFCPKYQRQRKDFYTYNDYLYHLKKEL